MSGIKQIISNWQIFEERTTAAVNTSIDLFLIFPRYSVTNLRGLMQITAYCEVIQLIHIFNIAGKRDSPFKTTNRMVVSEYHE